MGGSLLPSSLSGCVHSPVGLASTDLPCRQRAEDGEPAEGQTDCQSVVDVHSSVVAFSVWLDRVEPTTVARAGTRLMAVTHVLERWVERERVTDSVLRRRSSSATVRSCDGVGRAGESDRRRGEVRLTFQPASRASKNGNLF